MAKVKGVDAIEAVPIGRDTGVSVPEGMWADAEGQEIYNAVARVGARGMAFAEHGIKERQDSEDSTFVSTATTRYQTRARELLRKMQSENADGAKDFTKLYTAALTQAQAEVEDEVKRELSPSSRAVSSWKERARAVDVGLTEASAVYEDGERKRFYFDKAERNVDAIGIAAGKGEITREEALRRAGAIVADASGTLNPNEARDLLQKAKRIVSVSYYTGLAERDPAGVLAMIKKRSADSFADEGLKPEDMRRIENAADATIRKNQHSAALSNSITNDDLRTYNQLRKDGTPIPPALEQSLRTRLGVGKRGADKVGQFDEVKNHWDRVDEAKSLPLPDLRKKVENLRAPENNPTFSDLRTSQELEARWKTGMREGDREFRALYNEMKPMALQGADLPRAKLDRMVQLGKEMEAPVLEAETMRLVTVAENVAAARKTPLSGAAALNQKAFGDREMFGEAASENDSLALQERAAVSQAFREKMAERDKDPRAYVDRYYPEINAGLRSEDEAMRRASVARLLEAQRAEGVLTGDLAILSKPEAAEAEARIQQTLGRERADVLRSLVTRYGPESVERIQRQMDKGQNLPQDARIILALPWGTGRDEELYVTSANLAEAYAVKSKKEGWKDLGIDSTVEKSMAGSSIAKMADPLKSFAGEPGGATRAGTYTDGVHQLAMFYKWKQGLSESEAIKKASNELFYNFYEVADRVRVPLTVDGNPTFVQGVRAKQDYYAGVDQIRKMPLHPAQYTPANLSRDPKIAEKQVADAREQFVQSIALKGYWATSPDGKGFRRYNDQGRPVVLKQDAPVADAQGRPVMRFVDYDFYAPPLTETGFWSQERGTPGAVGRSMRFLGIEGRQDPLMQRWPQPPTRPGAEP